MAIATAYLSTDEAYFLITKGVFTPEQILDVALPEYAVIDIRTRIDELKDVLDQIQNFYKRADIVKLDDITFDPRYKLEALNAARQQIVSNIYVASGIANSYQDLFVFGEAGAIKYDINGDPLCLM